MFVVSLSEFPLSCLPLSCQSSSSSASSNADPGSTRIRWDGRQTPFSFPQSTHIAMIDRREVVGLRPGFTSLCVESPSRASPSLTSCLATQAALEKEEEARAEFLKIKAEHEARLDKHHQTSFDLLTCADKHHLTGACFKTFKRFVSTSPGWSAHRIAATEEERIKFKVKRVHPVYSVIVEYDPEKATKSKAAEADENRRPAQQPKAKRSKT